MTFNIQNSKPFVEFDFGINVQKGLIENFSAVGTFGYNDDVSTSFETVSSVGGVYSYPTTATTATVTSSNTASDNTGTVLVSGLDENYDLASETLTIGGGAGSITFIRVFTARMLTANTGNANVGNLTVTVDSKTVAYVQATYGASLSAIYTIPRNKRGWIVSASIGMSKQKEVESKILKKQVSNGNVWNTVGYQTTFGVPVYRKFEIPILVDQKSDIELRAKADATSAISGSFSLYLEDYH
jgi:hypothetical protein